MISEQLHVLMPTYNRQHMLDRTLSGLLAQDADPDSWHLTVVDNSSTDDTTSLLSRYAAKFRNFDFVVNPRNLGLFGNLNQCMQLARTNKYLIVHSDDDIDSTLVSSVLRFIKRYPEIKMAFGRCRARFEDTGEVIPYWHKSRALGEEERILESNELLITLMRSASNFIFAPTVIYDREFFGSHLRYSERYKFTSDLDLWFRVALIDPPIGFLPTPQITCGIHTGRLSSKNATPMRLEAIDIIRNYLSIVRGSHDPKLVDIGAASANSINLKLWLYEFAIRLHLIPGFKLRRSIMYLLEALTSRVKQRTRLP